MDTFETQQNLEAKYVMHTYGRKPVEFVQGSGMRLTDSKGKEYLDFLSGIGTVSLGHCAPMLVSALQNQTNKLMHVSNYYYIEERGEVGEQLSFLLDQQAASNEHEDWQSFFANSGAEANECAIKLARLWGKKTGNGNLIVTLQKSFHGRTLTTLSATAQPGKQDMFKPLPGGFIHVPLNDLSSLEKLFSQQGDEICALMIECVQGEGGVNVCTQDYLDGAQALLKEYKALLICDEIQCGMFRCGTYPFAYQHFNVQPDIVTMAKGIASGFPTGVCAARTQVASCFEPGDHGSTFGGSCLAIAAINATLAQLTSLGFADQVTEVGAYLRARLEELPHVQEVRGIGQMNAVQFSEEVDAAKLVDRALEAGLIINNVGPHTLRFLPPLICAKPEVDECMETLSLLMA